MELAQKQQIEFYLMNAVQRANEFFDLGQQKEFLEIEQRMNQKTILITE